MYAIKLAVIALIVLHAADNFLHEIRSKWPCREAWRDAESSAKLTVFLRSVAWTTIKLSPIAYYSMAVYDHL